MRKKVRTTYQRAGSSPSKRQKGSERPTEAISESHLSPLARYIEENEGNGIPVSELVEQFRELDCEHRNEFVLAQSNTKRVLRCEDCGRTVTVEK